MKVYTKTGDKGMTSLIGGTRVAKNNVRLDAYGGVDELNSHIGMIRSYPIAEEAARQLVEIQNVLFVVGANLATDAEASDLQRNFGCFLFFPKFTPRYIFNLNAERGFSAPIGIFHHPCREQHPVGEMSVKGKLFVLLLFALLRLV